MRSCGARRAWPNRGRSGGYRSIVLFRSGERAFFAFGFAKNQMENISKNNLKAFRILATTLLNYDDEQLAELLESGETIEVNCDEENL